MFDRSGKDLYIMFHRSDSNNNNNNWFIEVK